MAEAPKAAPAKPEPPSVPAPSPAAAPAPAPAPAPASEDPQPTDAVPAAPAAPSAPAEGQDSSQPSAPPKVLVIGDDNLMFTSGLQDAYPSIEFTVISVLARQNLEAYRFDPLPQNLRGRIRHMVNPAGVGKVFPQSTFDGIMLFLPGLSFQVPRELGTADRPLFAYRIHLFVFHVIRHAKLVLKAEGQLHLAWPDQNSLMASPCGAAGIEMEKLMTFCGCIPVCPMFEMERVNTDSFWPFLFGQVPMELPEWLGGTRIQSYIFGKDSIPIPLSGGLTQLPDVGFVSLKDATAENSDPAPSPTTPLRVFLLKEAEARKDRLKEIYGPRERPGDTPDMFGLVHDPLEEDALLSIPMEIFMVSFDDVPHISMLLKYSVCFEQPPVSVASLEVLDPRLPTRIVRPPVPKTGNALLDAQIAGSSLTGKKRARPAPEEWGGMKFYCSLTKICTETADRMRLHMEGDLYKRLAAKKPDWEDSVEKKDLIIDLEEAEAIEEHQKKARKSSEKNDERGGKGERSGKAKTDERGGKGRKGRNKESGKGKA